VDVGSSALYGETQRWKTDRAEKRAVILTMRGFFFFRRDERG
jgi:hypothetical protein